MLWFKLVLGLNSSITTEVVNAHVLIIKFDKLLFMQEFNKFNKDCGIRIMTHVQPIYPQSTVRLCYIPPKQCHVITMWLYTCHFLWQIYGRQRCHGCMFDLVMDIWKPSWITVSSGHCPVHCPALMCVVSLVAVKHEAKCSVCKMLPIVGFR